MKCIVTLFSIVMMSSFACASGETVAYKVGEEAFEGYFTTPSSNAH